ncbi:MAG: histidine kinase N-terminal 7TM domain-containing protein [Eubacteriales bacterium]|nr:histidine kinase N-terminal 7TM domain-containing protein [Eubacteriales bacterium]
MDTEFYIVCITIVLLTVMGVYIITAKKKSLLHYIFFTAVIEVFIWNGAVLMLNIFSGNQSLYFFCENMTYFGSALVPVSLVLLGRAYAQPEKRATKKFLLLLIIPIITQIMVWTNGLHHWFYLEYASMGNYNTPGAYFYVHAAYSYILLAITVIMLSYFAIKNSGILSIQAVMIMVGSIIPFLINILYTLNVSGFNAYSTPIAFTFTLGLYLLAMFRFNFLKVTPIALQTVMNRISDSFVVVDTDLNIIDYNKTFTENFHNFSGLRKGGNFYRMLQEADLPNTNFEQLRDMILKATETSETIVEDIEIDINGSRQYYTVDFTPIVQRNRCIAVILLFKNITQHIKDMQKIQDNQAILLERERLASLGQLIGGIAHNLKTPIMSVAGGIDQLNWLAKEYIESIGDAQVTGDDHKEIAGEMQQWLAKMKTHMSYMSDIISTVKDQATKFNNPGQTWFTIDEMLKRVKILMQHEIVKNKCKYVQDLKVDSNTRIDGDINSMVQILDNVIVNAIQSYSGKGGDIILKVTQEENMLLMTICDFGQGIDDKIKDRLFKEMVTTKGKHGTGLGLYMSYSTIKGMFRGNMWFDSSKEQGTKFYIQLPIEEEQRIEVDQYA